MCVKFLYSNLKLNLFSPINCILDEYNNNWYVLGFILNHVALYLWFITNGILLEL